VLVLNEPPDIRRGGSLRTSAFRTKAHTDARRRRRRFNVGRVLVLNDPPARLLIDRDLGPSVAGAGVPTV